MDLRLGAILPLDPLLVVEEGRLTGSGVSTTPDWSPLLIRRSQRVSGPMTCRSPACPNNASCDSRRHLDRSQDDLDRHRRGGANAWVLFVAEKARKIGRSMWRWTCFVSCRTLSCTLWDDDCPIKS